MDLASRSPNPSLIMGYPLGKRIFDMLFSGAMLLLGIPLFALLALLIKLTSPGPVFYSSQRIGKEGHLFTCWKFRSMFLNADQQLESLLSKNPQYKKEWEQYYKLKNDPRLTSIGKILRRTSLDEFPQFFNVLKGELSLVGPRPFLPNELDQIRLVLQNQSLSSDPNILFSVHPGLTGLWQISGRNHLTFEQRVRLDLHYLDKKSFLFDLIILWKTIPVLLFSKGAF